MYYLILTTLLVTNGLVEIKQTTIERFGIIEECASYKRKVEKAIPEGTTNVFFDCRRGGI